MRKKILLVDDEEYMLNLVSATLGADPEYDLFMAYDGRAALELAHREKPDVVILDILMPGMDGHAVCKALKTSPTTAHAKVIVLSAWPSRPIGKKRWQRERTGSSPSPSAPLRCTIRWWRCWSSSSPSPGRQAGVCSAPSTLIDCHRVRWPSEERNGIEGC